MKKFNNQDDIDQYIDEHVTDNISLTRILSCSNCNYATAVDKSPGGPYKNLLTSCPMKDKFCDISYREFEQETIKTYTDKIADKYDIDEKQRYRLRYDLANMFNDIVIYFKG